MILLWRKRACRGKPSLVSVKKYTEYFCEVRQPLGACLSLLFLFLYPLSFLPLMQKTDIFLLNKGGCNLLKMSRVLDVYVGYELTRVEDFAVRGPFLLSLHRWLRPQPLAKPYASRVDNPRLLDP